MVHLLILVTLSSLSATEDETDREVPCPGNQKGFGGSCFEFVGLERSFLSAQAWCEQSGGHLAFVPNEDTQRFLQRHLDPEKDTWFGAAASETTNLQSPAAEGTK